MAGAVGAELRTLEAVGSVPIMLTGESAIAPRDAAVEAALREAVTRVAQEFLADRVLEEPNDDPNPLHDPESLDDADLISADSPWGEDEAVSDQVSFDLDAILGSRMVPYTSRFRVIEDRGRRPALFAEDPAIREEYVVIVEVQIDVERVRARLVEAELIPAGAGGAVSNAVVLEVEGLKRYSAFQDFRGLLIDRLDVRGVTPLEIRRGHVVLDVATEATPVEFLEALLTVAPPHMEIVPRHARGSRIHVVVRWHPALEAPSTHEAEVLQEQGAAGLPTDG